MLSKIDIRSIFYDHFKTLRNYSTGKLKKADFVVFLGIPLFVAAMLIVWHGPLPTNLISVISTSLSVSVALLLNLFVLTYNTVLNSDPPKPSSKTSTQKDETSTRKKLAEEIISNIAFAIVIALMIIVLALYFGIAHTSISKQCSIALTATIYYLGALFGLTMLMLLNRLYALLQGELHKLDR